MKKITKYYSGIGLTKTSVAIGLSALLCVPTVGHAEGVAIYFRYQEWWL